MRIMHVVHGFPPRVYGGVENYTHTLANEQAKHHDVYVFTRIEDFDKNNGEVINYTYDALTIRGVVNNFPQKSILRNSCLSNPLIEEPLRQFVHEISPDLIHIQHTIGLSVRLIGVADGFKLPLIHTIHDWWYMCPRIQMWKGEGSPCDKPTILTCSHCSFFQHSIYGVLNPFFYLLRKELFRYYLNKVDYLIFGSQYIKNCYLNCGYVDAAKAFVIPHGVHCGFKAPSRRKRKSRIRFGYVGTIAPHKGVHLLMKAFERFRDGSSELNLFGNDTVFLEYTNSLKSMSKNPNIHFYGNFSQDEVEDIFSRIDVLVLPSTGHESYSLVVREANSRGIPAIVSDFGALREAVIHGVNGLRFKVGDWKDLKQKMRMMIKRPELIEKFRRNLPSPPTMEEYAEKIEEIYHLALP